VNGRVVAGVTEGWRGHQQQPQEQESDAEWQMDQPGYRFEQIKKCGISGIAMV
jgi:hypothetical protein